MSGINGPFQGRQCAEGGTRQDIIVSEEGIEEVPGPGTALTASWPANPDLVVPAIQKDFDVWAAPAGGLLESALAPVSLIS